MRQRGKKYFRLSQCQTLRAKWVLAIFLGSLFIAQREREQKEGPSFVFAETSLLSGHLARCLKSSQGETPSPSQRGCLDAGSSCSGAWEPSRPPLETEGDKDPPQPSRQPPEAQNRFVTR